MRSIIAALFAASTLAGCASSTPAREPGMKAMAGHDGMRPECPADCPMKDKNVTVTGEDVDGGAALVFKSSGDVASLRAHVAKMVEHHNGMASAEHKPMGMMAGMPASNARAEEVDGGVRLIFTPTSPADLEALRAHVKTHTANAGSCPMHQSHR
jgi:hypothetical protein